MLRELIVVAAFLVTACSLFPDSPPEARGRGDGGASGGTAGRGSGGSGNAGAAGQGSGGSSAMGGVSGADGGGAGGVDSGPPTDAPFDGTAAGGADGGPEAAPDGSTEVVYLATLADCIEEGIQNPDACLALASASDGPNELWVSGRAPPLQTITGYLRFDVDTASVGRTVAEARVELTVTSYVNAAGTLPDVWQVATFTRPSLFTGVPTVVGGAPVAASPGMASAGQVVVFNIPPGLVVPGAPLTLSLVSTNRDGVGFWNRLGAFPPRLVVGYR